MRQRARSITYEITPVITPFSAETDGGKLVSFRADEHKMIGVNGLTHDIEADDYVHGIGVFTLVTIVNEDEPKTQAFLTKDEAIRFVHLELFAIL